MFDYSQNLGVDLSRVKTIRVPLTTIVTYLFHQEKLPAHLAFPDLCLPPGTQVVRGHFDPISCYLVVVITHPSFEPVPEFAEIPPMGEQSVMWRQVKVEHVDHGPSEHWAWRRDAVVTLDEIPMSGLQVVKGIGMSSWKEGWGSHPDHAKAVEEAPSFNLTGPGIVLPEEEKESPVVKVVLNNWTWEKEAPILQTVDTPPCANQYVWGMDKVLPDEDQPTIVELPKELQ